MPITIIATAARFPLGHVTATPGALDLFTSEEIATAIERHAAGDWGEVGPEDAAENALSLSEGFRLLSAYTFQDRRMWLITEADRSVTTVLLPEEY